MKKRFLPFGLFSFILLSLAGFLIFASGLADKEISPANEGAQSIEGAAEYLASIRNNQHTGILDPRDVVSSDQEFEAQANLKSSSKAFTWAELGPDNMGGKARGLIFDNRDANGNTIYAGSATGGIFKSVNSGSTWNKVNTASSSNNLNVSCMVQNSDGTIYAGTGEGFGANNYTAYSQYGYEGGFVGKGIFKSNNEDKFALVAGTEPTVQGEVTEWAYINDLAIGNNRLFAATHTGLKYASLPDLASWSSDIKYKLDSAVIFRGISIDSIASCDSFEIVNGDYVLYGSSGWEVDITGEDTTNVQSSYSGYMAFELPAHCYDVKVNESGVLYAGVNGRVFVSQEGDPLKLVNRSIYPKNPYYVRQDNIQWTSNVVITDKQGNVLHQGGNTTSEMVDWHTDYKYSDVLDMQGYPHSEDGGRTEIAIAPSDQTIAYAMVAKGNNPNKNSLVGIYLTEDNGQTWRKVAPGGSPSLNILGSTYGTANTPYYQGDYSNTIVVYPNNPYKVLAGGVDLWYGEKINEEGYYSWARKSYSTASTVGGIYSPFYCHSDHHVYLFKPNNGNRVYIASDGGIFLASISGTDFAFQSINKNFNAAQFYTLDISVFANEFVGGAQDIGTVYVPGGGNNGKAGYDIWTPANFSPAFPEGTDGGSVAFTTLYYVNAGGEEVYSPVFYSKGPRPQGQTLIQRTRRSETMGFDFSLDFLSSGITDNRFITPMAVWESYNNQASQVTTRWAANKDYAAGDPVVVRSNIYDYPFNYFLEEAVSEGDTLDVKDIISNKLFIAVEDQVYMSLNAVDFAVAPTWYLISANNHAGVDGKSQCIGFSADANYLWVGTQEGRLFRISNIANAYDQNTADVSSVNCIIATTEVILPGDLTQVVTSVSVDPANPDKVLVTLGNYGNANYVFYCTNGTGDTPEFVSKQGNLPKMPVYSGILEMDINSDQAIIGTEKGVWASDNIATGEWYFASADIGRIPVMAIKQRTFYKSAFVITYTDPATGESSWDIYPEIQNYKDIFIATHGRGVFKYDVEAVGVEENPTDPQIARLPVEVYPNPATTAARVNINLDSRQDVRIDIYDFAGRLVMSEQTGQLPSGAQEVNLNVSALQEGTYLLRVTAGNSTGTKKFIVVK